MKIQNMCICLILATRLNAFAKTSDDSTTPLIEKSSATGFVPVGYQRNELCQVYKNKVVIKKEIGTKSGDTVTFTQEVAITLSPEIHILIEEVQKIECVMAPALLYAPVI
jgi:hypothetical protein